MENKNLFKNFIEDEFSMGYFNSIDSSLRWNLSTISCWCKTLSEASDDECDADFRTEVANNIIKICCSMLRPADVVSKIVEVNKGYRVTKNIVELSIFFTEFCNNCNERMEKKCKVQMKKSSKIYIEVSEKFFLAVMLMCVRNALFNQVNKIDISCTEKLNTVTISMKMKKSRTENFMFSDTDFDGLYDYTHEIMSFFTEKIGGEIEISENEIIIKLPSVSEKALHEKKPPVPDTSVFNQYNIQLAEFNDFSYY